MAERGVIALQILDGQLVANEHKNALKSRVAEWTKSHRAPGLAVILVGEDPASQVYVRNKIKACQSVGIQSIERKVPVTISQKELEAEILRLNEDVKVDGILLQLPLPKGLNADAAIACIDPNKDADALTILNQGRLWAGHPLTSPCTPSGVMAILDFYKLTVSGMEAVVVGRSAIVGRPMAHLLNQANATVTICHSRTKDLRRHTRAADIVVVAAGQPEFLKGEDFKDGAIVIDVGMHRKTSADGKTRLCGDVKNQGLEKLKAVTPVPGGVGPMTIAMLLENTMRLAERAR